MSTKIIPAQTINTCDCCGITMDRSNWRQGGELVLKAHALDMQGSPCADATRKLDLCDACLYKVGKAIDSAMAPPQGVAYAELPESYQSSTLIVGNDGCTVTFHFGTGDEADVESWLSAVTERASNGQAPAAENELWRERLLNEDIAWLEMFAPNTAVRSHIIDVLRGAMDGQAPAGATPWRSAVLDLIDECPGLTMEQDHWLSRRVKELEFASAPRPTAQTAPALAENGHLTQAGHDLLMEATLAGATLVSKGRLVGDMAQAAPAADPAYSEACSLATALFEKHYRQEPDYASGRVVWSLCDTTAGVISQIDNMVSGLALAPAADYDHGPQSTTVAEAARHVGKWLNERPNRPLDLRDVAMLVAHAQAPAAGAVAGPNMEALRHSANEWADMATNGLQWLRNIVAGASDAKTALENMESNLAHCRAVNDAPEVQAAIRAAAAPTPAAQADGVLEDAALLHYALADGGNQSMNWQDVYDDWNGEGYFIDALRAAYKQDAARKQGGKHDNH